jgi:hypothetical protein
MVDIAQIDRNANLELRRQFNDSKIDSVKRQKGDYDIMYKQNLSRLNQLRKKQVSIESKMNKNSGGPS